MSFIFKFVLILLIFSFVVYVLKAIVRLSFRLRRMTKEMFQMRDQMLKQPGLSAEMVKCQTCGAFVASRDAVLLKMQKQTRTYCSEECLRLHKIGV